MATAAKKDSGPINLPELKRNVFTAYIWGDSPLIVHAWSQKAICEMIAKQMGQQLPKLPKSPGADFLASLYRMEDGGYCFPATALKKALVSACRSMNKEITMTIAQQAFLVRAEQGWSVSGFGDLKTPMQMVRVYSPNAPSMREDAVRIGLGGKTADLRYRAEIWPWAMKVELVYNEHVVTRATVAALVDTAGFAVGLGEWRQEKTGTYGSFRLADQNEIKQIEKWMKQPHKEPTLPDEKKFLRDLHEQVRLYGVQEEEPSGEVPAEIIKPAAKGKSKTNGGVRT